MLLRINLTNFYHARVSAKKKSVPTLKFFSASATDYTSSLSRSGEINCETKIMLIGKSTVNLYHGINIFKIVFIQSTEVLVSVERLLELLRTITTPSININWSLTLFKEKEIIANSILCSTRKKTLVPAKTGALSAPAYCSPPRLNNQHDATQRMAQGPAC
jgi:hypothetical protein